jgi:hypothetical protein
MKPVRAVCGVFVAVCIGYETSLNPLIGHANNIGPRDSIETIVKDATADGGSVVLCRNHVCLDLASHEDVGEPEDGYRDGYYITFPKQDDYQEKIKWYQERIQRWIEQR